VKVTYEFDEEDEHDARKLFEISGDMLSALYEISEYVREIDRGKLCYQRSSEMDELYEEMIKKYPNLYRINKSIDCGPGWFPLLDDLSKALELMILELKIEQEKCVLEIEENSKLPCAVEVKEEDRALSFHMSESTDEMEQLIKKAERESSRICENCGKKGHVVSAHWYGFMCEDCSEWLFKNKQSVTCKV